MNWEKQDVNSELSDATIKAKLLWKYGDPVYYTPHRVYFQ
jgi:hypothetical protein